MSASSTARYIAAYSVEDPKGRQLDMELFVRQLFEVIQSEQAAMHRGQSHVRDTLLIRSSVPVAGPKPGRTRVTYWLEHTVDARSGELTAVRVQRHLRDLLGVPQPATEAWSIRSIRATDG